MFGRVSHAGHGQDSDHQHPLLRQAVVAVLIALVLAAIILLLAADRAHATFLY